MIRKNKDYFIKENQKISECLKLLNKNYYKCLFVLGKNKKIKGSVTDGDLRRGLLNGFNLDDFIKNIYKKNFIYYEEKKIDLRKVRQIFKNDETHIDLIPILNKEKKFIRFLTKHEKNNKKRKLHNLTVCIMAGGLGTRLKPYSLIIPKPLFPIKGQTLIELIIDGFLEYGLKSMNISIGYKKDLVKAYLSQFKKYKINYLEENKSLGTAGPLYKLKSQSKKNIIVTNCDNPAKINYDSFYDFHINQKNDLTIATVSKDYQIPYGVCEIDKNTGKLKKLNEKPKYFMHINTGIYIINRKCLALIKKEKKMNMDSLINALSNNNYKIGTYPLDDDWYDAGTYENFKELEDKIN